MSECLSLTHCVLCKFCKFCACLSTSYVNIYRIILSEWLDRNFAIYFCGCACVVCMGGLCRSCTWIDYYCNAVLLAGFWQLAKDPRENDKQVVNYFDEIHTHSPTQSDVLWLETEKAETKIDNYRLSKQWKNMPNASSVLLYKWYPNTQRASNKYNPLFEVFCLVFQAFLFLFCLGGCEAE